jgi:hypothetical protein
MTWSNFKVQTKLRVHQSSKGLPLGMLPCNYYTWMVVTDNGKVLSLSWHRINYSCKKVLCIRRLSEKHLEKKTETV